jgi:thioredoxin
MSKAQAVGEDDFEAQVLRAEVPVIVDFWAPWCPPCRALGPVVDRVAEKYVGQATILKCDVDQNPGVAARYGVSTIPNLTFFKGGEVVGQEIGYVNEAALSKKLDDVLAG